jgi:hypothetical protein
MLDPTMFGSIGSLPSFGGASSGGFSFPALTSLGGFGGGGMPSFNLPTSLPQFSLPSSGSSSPYGSFMQNLPQYMANNAAFANTWANNLAQANPFLQSLNSLGKSGGSFPSAPTGPIINNPFQSALMGNSNANAAALANFNRALGLNSFNNALGQNNASPSFSYSTGGGGPVLFPAGYGAPATGAAAGLNKGMSSTHLPTPSQQAIGMGNPSSGFSYSTGGGGPVLYPSPDVANATGSTGWTLTSNPVPVGTGGPNVQSPQTPSNAASFNFAGGSVPYLHYAPSANPGIGTVDVNDPTLSAHVAGSGKRLSTVKIGG